MDVILLWQHQRQRTASMQYGSELMYSMHRAVHRLGLYYQQGCYGCSPNDQVEHGQCLVVDVILLWQS